MRRRPGALALAALSPDRRGQRREPAERWPTASRPAPRRWLVPGALGVQEGALAVLGALFGVPLPAALALSLIRRGRDLALALPVLALWQARHGARIWTRRRGDQAETDVPARNASNPRARSSQAGQSPQP